jgi:hypothetical protein
MKHLWERELDALLASLGVEQEHADREQPQPEIQGRYEEIMPTFTVWQASLHHRDVFYRIDLIGMFPELRVFVPEDTGLLKVQIYRVRLSVAFPLVHQFASIELLEGSATFQETRGALSYHTLCAVAELMKALFWQGDREHGSFPPEIVVDRLA